MSAVGKGDYAAAHNDHDTHATAPSPVPADAKWWVGIDRSDGTKNVGSVLENVRDHRRKYGDTSVLATHDNSLKPVPIQRDELYCLQHFVAGDVLLSRGVSESSGE